MDETTAQKLADLDATFNTNPGFGLMGMLQNQDPQQPQQQEQQSAPPAQEGKEPEWFDLLNQTIQTKSKRDEEMLSTFAQKLGTIESRLSQPQQAPGEFVDDSDPIQSELRQLRTNQAQLVIDSSFERARNAVARIRAQHPDTEISEGDVRKAFDLNNLAANPDLARRMDWEAYFDAEHKRTAAPKAEARVKQLEQELSLLKSGRGIEDMASVPRSSRSPVQANVNAKDDGIDEEVYKAASARMGKGKFAGFGRVLFEEQQKRRGRLAV